MAARRWGIGLMLLAIPIGLAIYAAIGYAAVHFILKFW